MNNADHETIAVLLENAGLEAVLDSVEACLNNRSMNGGEHNKAVAHAMYKARIAFKKAYKDYYAKTR